MKTFKAKAGPFQEGAYYPDDEIENICSGELLRVGLLPREPEPIRIDRFIEKRFDVVPSYEDLGEGVLGLTKFTSKGVAAVIVSRSLEEEGSKVAGRRVRTTLAHEGGHGLLHTHLFVLNAEKRQLFADYTEPGKPKVLCRDETAVGQNGYRRQWWEIQANKAMSALLLPKQLVQLAVKPFLTSSGLLGFETLAGDNRMNAIRELAEIFDVNPVVVRIRLGQMYPENGQLSL
jgi:hypothetical protein